jgi:hypothetical protein
LLRCNAIGVSSPLHRKPSKRRSGLMRYLTVNEREKIHLHIMALQAAAR